MGGSMGHLVLQGICHQLNWLAEVVWVVLTRPRALPLSTPACSEGVVVQHTRPEDLERPTALRERQAALRERESVLPSGQQH